MIKLSLDDVQFVGQYSSSWYNKPKNLEWEREAILDNRVFLTDRSVYKNRQYFQRGIETYAFLIESPWNTLTEHQYTMLDADKFKRIFTHYAPLLKFPNARFVSGGCYIAEQNWGIYSKHKLISMFCSGKRHLPGHIIRHYIKDTFKDDVEGYGEGFGNPIDVYNKIIGLEDYRYQIVVENAKEDYYFTEKIIDCFLTGTIPIYWGCPSISKFFNIDGIIQFNTITELDRVLAMLSVTGTQDYLERMNAIKDNFELAKQYVIPEDYMITKYRDEI